jgi:hypothetical protein
VLQAQYLPDPVEQPRPVVWCDDHPQTTLIQFIA